MVTADSLSSRPSTSRAPRAAHSSACTPVPEQTSSTRQPASDAGSAAATKDVEKSKTAFGARTAVG
jgi:hypothetical protein